MPRKKTLRDIRRVEVLLPAELLAMLDSEAKRRHSSRSETLRSLLQESLETPKVDPERGFGPPGGQTADMELVLGKLDTMEQDLRLLSSRMDTTAVSPAPLEVEGDPLPSPEGPSRRRARR